MPLVPAEQPPPDRAHAGGGESGDQGVRGCSGHEAEAVTVRKCISAAIDLVRSVDPDDVENRTVSVTDYSCRVAEA